MAFNFSLSIKCVFFSFKWAKCLVILSPTLIYQTLRTISGKRRVSSFRANRANFRANFHFPASSLSLSFSEIRFFSHLGNASTPFPDPVCMKKLGMPPGHSTQFSSCQGLEIGENDPKMWRRAVSRSLPRLAFYLSIGFWNLPLFEKDFLHLQMLCSFFATLAKCHGTRKVKKSAETNAKVGAVLIFGTLPFEFLFF